MKINSNLDSSDNWVSEHGILIIKRDDGKHLTGEYVTYGSPATWDYYGTLEDLIDNPEELLDKAQELYFNHWSEVEIDWDDLMNGQIAE